MRLRPESLIRPSRGRCLLVALGISRARARARVELRKSAGDERDFSASRAVVVRELEIYSLPRLILSTDRCGQILAIAAHKTYGYNDIISYYRVVVGSPEVHLKSTYKVATIVHVTINSL